MPQITKSVNKTRVHGDETFIYTFNVSYSRLTEPTVQGKLTDFFPTKIIPTLPQASGYIKNITQAPVAGGTLVTFDFGEIPTGTSISFQAACKFGPGRVNNDSFTNSADLYADNVIVNTGVAQTVTLTLTEDFRLNKSVQGSSLVRPGDIVTFSLYILNYGDSGAEISDVVITDTLPNGLTPDLSFIPIGNDASELGYNDPTYNGRTGSWNDRTLTFTLPSFKGNGYSITFKAIVDMDVVPGKEIINTANWKVNSIVRDGESVKLRVFNQSDIFAFEKDATRTGTVGTPITYGLVNTNQDNKAHTNYQIIDTLPEEVDITKLRFQSNSIGLPSYSIFISLSSSPDTFISILKNSSDNTDLIDLTPFITAGTNVSKIKITAPTLNNVSSSHTLQLYGVINKKAQSKLGQTIINTAIASADGITESTSAGTVLNGASDLQVSKGIIPDQPAYAPLDEFEYVLISEPLNTITINPIFADLLPTDVFYVPDSEYFIYQDGITGITYDSRNPGFPVPLPTKEVLENYKNTGRTLLRWSFDNFTIALDTNLQVYFKAFIKITSNNTIVNNAYVGNPGDDVFFVYNAIEDTNDYDGDGITDEFISSSSTTSLVLLSSEFVIKKLVKGDLDLDYSSLGNVTPGGNIDYQYYITNNQDVNLKDIQLVDILPYVGDTGLILTSTPRGSQFEVYPTAIVTAEIINVLGESVESNPEISIEYSTSNNPIRFDQKGNQIGTGTWSIVPPTDFTTIRAVKVTTKSNVLLKPYERLIVHIQAKAPVDVPVNKIAYNSFAVKANQVKSDGSTEPLLPTEPNKVGVQTLHHSKSSIGGFVWEDLNGNGIYDEYEPGVNGITVELYDYSIKLISSTVTSNNYNGKPGYYLFTNLNAGKYYVKFRPYGDYKLTIQQASSLDGSKPNKTTGLTDIIYLGSNESKLDIDAGIFTILCPPPTINASNKCIRVGDPFNPLDGVSATDCRGNQLTATVVSNNVNNQVPGTYTVIYSATDCYGRKTTKTIYVKVCPTGPYELSISNLIQSVALEQAGIRNILNAESLKLRKIVANGTAEQMLCAQESVNDMIKTLTNLELVLLNKLDIFSCQLCDDCCAEDGDCPSYK